MEFTTLHNGIQIPMVGLGVYLTEAGEQTENAVKWAVSAGYRHIDTAKCYDNEQSVGQGIRDCGVAREDLFITTKIWNTEVRAGVCRQAFETSMDKLGLDYLDLYLIHWAADGFQSTWKVMEELYKEGRIRAIGVSNFTKKHLDMLDEVAEIRPMVNQIQSYPKFSDQGLIDLCHARDIAVQAWSPLGGTGSDLLTDPVLQIIAQKHGKSTAQVVIRWHVQRGVIVLPKSVQQARIASNIDIFDFALDADDMAQIATMETYTRMGSDPENIDF